MSQPDNPGAVHAVLTRCPHCFVELRPDHYAFRCTNLHCAEEVDVTLSTYRGLEERGRTVIDLGPQPGHPLSAVCTTCRVPTEQEVCPECHYALLAGWRWCTTTCMAMAGARDSGKSIYIGVLKKQAELWCERYGRALVAPDPRTDEQYKRIYQTPLYETRGLIPPTPSARAAEAPHREPLVFHVGQFAGRHHMLVLRDVAGEDLEHPPPTAAPFRFFSRADVVTFLFDPMHLEDIRGQLEGVAAPQRMDSGDPLEVLRNLIRLMHGGLAFGERLQIPLALVLAKFDTLAELAHIDGAPLASIMRNPGATFNLDPSMDPDFDRADAARLQAEVESLLVRLQARTLLNLVDSSFAERQLFAVSALGALPSDAQRVSARGIAPFRVLDPLKWAFARTGVISYS